MNIRKEREFRKTFSQYIKPRVMRIAEFEKMIEFGVGFYSDGKPFLKNTDERSGKLIDNKPVILEG